MGCGGMYCADPEQAVKTYADMVYRLAAIKTSQRADAEEVFSEVFLKLVQHAHKIQSEEHLKAWLIKVTIRCANSHHTTAWKRKVLLMDGDDPFEGSTEQAFPSDNLVLNAVRQLGGKYRDVIHLHYYEGFGVQEIAAILGSKEGTVKSLLFRAREQLRGLLEKDLEQYPDLLS